MQHTLGGIDVGGLERSGGRPSDSIRFGPSAQGVERAEVYLSTRGFDPHRHDTYGIGVTMAGVPVSAITVSVADALVTEPTVLLITTE